MQGSVVFKYLFERKTYQHFLSSIKNLVKCKETWIVLEWMAALALFILAVILVPIAVPVYLIVLSYSLFTGFMIRSQYGHGSPEGYPSGLVLNSGDTLCVRGNTCGSNIIHGVFFLERMPDVEFVTRTLMDDLVQVRLDNGLPRFPRFKMFVDSWCGLYFWRYDANFDIKHHIRVYEGEDIVGDDQLRSVLADICNEGLPPIRAGWECVLVPFRSQAGDGEPLIRCCTMFRVHHAMGDGIAWLRVFLATVLTDEEGESVGERLEASIAKQYATATKMTLTQKLSLMLRAVFFAPYFAITTSLFDDKSALHGKTLAKNFLLSWTETIPLDLFRSVRSQTNSTVNDLFASCLAGALRRYCQANGKDVPKTCTACIPVSMHSLREPAMLKNDHSFVFCRLPVDMDSPLERLATLKASMNKVKSSPEVIHNRWWVTLMLNCFPRFAMESMLDVSPVTLVASNIPGPQFPFWLFEKKVTSCLVLLPHRSKLGIGISMISYNGGVRMAITMDRCLEGDQHGVDSIARYFQDELQLLDNLTCS